METATCTISAYKIENLIDILRAVVFVVACACHIVYGGGGDIQYFNIPATPALSCNMNANVFVIMVGWVGVKLIFF